MVVDLFGMFARPAAMTGDGLAVDLAEPTGLTDATAVLDVFQDRGVGLRGELGVKERSALSFGEAGLAGAAAEESGLVGAVVAGRVTAL